MKLNIPFILKWNLLFSAIFMKSQGKERTGAQVSCYWCFLCPPPIILTRLECHVSSSSLLWLLSSGRGVFKYARQTGIALTRETEGFTPSEPFSRLVVRLLMLEVGPKVGSMLSEPEQECWFVSLYVHVNIWTIRQNGKQQQHLPKQFCESAPWFRPPPPHYKDLANSV